MHPDRCGAPMPRRRMPRGPGGPFRGFRDWLRGVLRRAMVRLSCTYLPKRVGFQKIEEMPCQPA